MPKTGFKSYALKEKLYDFWKNEFEDNKEELLKLGITSFSAYLTSIMNKSLERSPPLQNESFMRMVYLKNNLLAIQDNVQNRVVDLLIKNGKITCLFDEKDDCMHVGFAYSIPIVRKLLNKKTNH
jgi:hypothetical protein